MTAQCAQCWRLYEPTADGVRRHQMLAGHRPSRSENDAIDELSKAICDATRFERGS